MSEQLTPVRLLSAAKVAQRCHISKQCFMRHVHRGMIPPDFEFDGGILYRAERVGEIAALIESNRAKHFRNLRKA